MNFVLFGPSAGGKTTFKHELTDRGCYPIISYTTREPRSGEIDGKDYHFISEQVFKKHSVWSHGAVTNKPDDRAEPYLCNITKIGGCWYGQHIPDDIHECESDIVMISDVKCITDFLIQSSPMLKKNHQLWSSAETVFVYLQSPSVEEQIRRQVKRFDKLEKINRGIREYTAWRDMTAVLCDEERLKELNCKFYKVESTSDWSKIFNHLQHHDNILS
tara:strand:- start:5744 stop:6394 length:651 start_codon:yes stop_codon:yes gene_type:complete